METQSTQKYSTLAHIRSELISRNGFLNWRDPWVMLGFYQIMFNTMCIMQLITILIFIWEEICLSRKHLTLVMWHPCNLGYGGQIGSRFGNKLAPYYMGLKTYQRTVGVVHWYTSA